MARRRLKDLSLFQERRRIGQRVEAVQKALGWTHKDVVEEIRNQGLGTCTPQYYGKIIRGEVQAQDRWLAAIATALEVPEAILRSKGRVADVQRSFEGMGFTCLRVQNLHGTDTSVRCIDAEVHNGLVLTPITIVCAPLVAPRLIEEVRRDLCARPTPPHQVVFVSEAPPRVEQGALPPDLPKIIVVWIEDIGRYLIHFGHLYERYAIEKPLLEARALNPRIEFRDDPAPALPFLLRWARERSGHLFLVAGAGWGKSRIVQRFKVRLAEEHRQNPSAVPFPFYISLSTWSQSANLRESLISAVLEQLRLANRLAVERALEEGQILVILDSLEHLIGGDPVRLAFVQRALEPVLSLGCPVLLTARSPYLLGREEEDEPVGLPDDPVRRRPPIRRAYLHELLPQDVHDFIGAHAPKNKAALFEQLDRHGLWERCRLPYILDMILEIQDATQRPFAEGVPVLPQLLDRCYKTWLRDEHATLNLNTEELRDLLGLLASELRRLGRPVCAADDLHPRLHDLLFPNGSAMAQPRSRNNRFLHAQGGAVTFVHTLVERYFFCCWVADRIRDGQAAGVHVQWITDQDLTLLSGMIRDTRSIEHLLEWLRDVNASPERRDLAAYLLAITGARDRVLPELRRVAETADRRSLVESVDFARIMLGDTRCLQQCVGSTVTPEPTRARTLARVQLLSLGLHSRLLPPEVWAEVEAAILKLEREEVATELSALVSSEEEAITTRASAAVSLGFVRAEQARPLLESLVEAYASQAALERSPQRLRLAMAARSALELMSVRGYLR